MGGYTRDLSEFVSRFGHIAVDVEVSTPGNRGGVPRSTGASNTPAAVARFLRELADDVERAQSPSPDREDSPLDAAGYPPGKGEWWPGCTDK
jgi:hypothetical protein